MRVLTLVAWVQLTLCCSHVDAHQKTMGVYVHYPVADPECADALVQIFTPVYKVTKITHDTLTTDTLKNIDCVVFPGGLGDSDVFDDVLIDRKDVVQKYMKDGGRYLGICMGAYFASHYYFNILDDVSVVQYIRRPRADTHQQNETVLPVIWNKKIYNMYFFDGCAIVGNIKSLRIFSTYKNGDIMAAIQGRVGVIGCHPESLEYWYEEANMNKHWHKGVHHRLLLEFTDKLLQ